MGICDATLSDFYLHQILTSDANVTTKLQYGDVHYFSVAPQHQHIMELVDRQRPRPRKKQDNSQHMNSTSFMSTTCNSTFSVGTFKRPLPMNSLRNKKRSANLRRRSSLSSINSSFSSSHTNNSTRDMQSVTLNSSIVSYAADRWSEFDKKNVSRKLKIQRWYFITFSD